MPQHPAFRKLLFLKLHTVYCNVFLEGMIGGKRDRGRQRRTWGDDVKEWSGWQSIGGVNRMSEDKKKWRVMVMVTNHLIEDGT